MGQAKWIAYSFPFLQLPNAFSAFQVFFPFQHNDWEEEGGKGWTRSFDINPCMLYNLQMLSDHLTTKTQ